MARKLTKRVIYILSIGGFIFALHAYKNAQWLLYLSERQKIFDDVTSRSLLPGSSASSRRETSLSPASPRDGQVSHSVGPLVNHDAPDHSVLPLCTRDQVKYGKWVPVQLEKPPYVSKNKHLRCYADEVYKQSPWHTWDWRPLNETCAFSEWNSDQFCQLMNKAPISIIGDSLSWEQYSALLQILGTKVRQSDQHKSKSENRNHLQTVCDMNTRVVFRNDPRLEFISDSIRNDFPVVLILNRGAHYVNDTTLLDGIRKNIQELQEWQQTCRRMRMRCHLFWRTTVPGHPRCTDFNETEPVNDLAAMESRVFNLQNYDNTTINFHWQDFARQNNLILQELEGSSLEYSVIDGYHLNILRPDEHRSHDGDCLHNCYPGKMDIYNQLLLHFLRIERSPEDVAFLVQQYERFSSKMPRGAQQQPNGADAPAAVQEK